MNRLEENQFRIQPAVPRGKQSRAGERFTTKVLRAGSRIGPMPSRTRSAKPRPTLARLGRGAAMTGLRGGPDVGRRARLGRGNDGWATLAVARAPRSSRVVS